MNASYNAGYAAGADSHNPTLKALEARIARADEQMGALLTQHEALRLAWLREREQLRSALLEVRTAPTPERARAIAEVALMSEADAAKIARALLHD